MAVRLSLTPVRRGERPRSDEIRDARALAVVADRSGLDALFLARSQGVDPYPVLGAIASGTDHLGLGALAAPAGERPPAVLAKVVTTLDVVSGARAILGLAPGAGDRALGADQPLEAEARVVAELADDLEICRAMVRVRAPSYSGATAAISSAWNEPRVEGVEPIPIALLVPGEARATPGAAELLPLGARFAELCAVELAAAHGRTAQPFTGPELRSIHDAACLASGRPPGEVPLLAVLPLRQGAARSGPVPDNWSVGELLERCTSARDAGFDGVVVDVGAGDLGDPRLANLVERLGSPGTAPG
jgi:Luciferase-like monooxygenase